MTPRIRLLEHRILHVGGRRREAGDEPTISHLARHRKLSEFERSGKTGPATVMRIDSGGGHYVLRRTVGAFVPMPNPDGTHASPSLAHAQSRRISLPYAATTVVRDHGAGVIFTHLATPH